MNHIESLLNQMESDRLPCHREIILDGHIHRYSCKDTPLLDEWYVGHPMSNGHLLCVYGSWRSSYPDKKVFKSWVGEDPALEKEHSVLMKSVEEAIAQEIKDGTKTAIEYFNSSSLCVEHPYLTRKKILPHFTKVYEGWLLIPVYDGEGKLISVQKIAGDGTKRFAKRTTTKFGRFVFGDLEKSKRVLVCEGFATGASIYEATQDCVVVAFSCGNLHKVGFDLSQSYKSKSIALCADLGASGVESSIKWKELVNQTVYFPDMKGKEGKEGKDFNDLAVVWGKDEVKKQLSLSIKSSTLKDLLTTSPDVEWLVKNLILKGSVNMIYGPASAGKSAVSMSLAFACSQGVKFWHYSPVKCRVLYVDGELSRGENKSRWNSILSRYGQDILANPDEETLRLVTPDMIYEVFETGIDLYQKEWQRRLDPLIEQAELIVFDNLSTLTGGQEDAEFENRASSWVVIGDWLRRWKGKGKSFLIVHHANKAGGMRGTSRVSVDTMTQIRLEPQNLEGTEAEVYAKVVFEKRREICGNWKDPYYVKLVGNRWVVARSGSQSPF